MPFTASSPRVRIGPRAVPLLLLLASCGGGGSPAPITEPPPAPPPAPLADASTNPAPLPGGVSAEVVAQGLEFPWGMAFLPDGRALVTERPGRLRLITPTTGEISAPLAGVPAVAAEGQGGLLDLTLDPQFATTRRLFFVYAEPAPDGTRGVALARATLAPSGGALQDVTVLWRQAPKRLTSNHFGARVLVRGDGTLLVTLGERGFLSDVQSLGTTIGKVVRVNADGSFPPDNPYAGQPGALPEIWSVGHRNPQAAALHPVTGELWTVEHGPRGGDELNRVLPGRNYGWPVISYGTEYTGAPIGEGTAKPGLEQPILYWNPAIAPSGATFVTGTRYPGWAGSLVVGAMVTRALVRLELGGTAAQPRVSKEERYLSTFAQRIRAVRQAPDGYLYLLTDAGQFVRVVPGTAL